MKSASAGSLLLFAAALGCGSGSSSSGTPGSGGSGGGSPTTGGSPPANTGGSGGAATGGAATGTGGQTPPATGGATAPTADAGNARDGAAGTPDRAPDVTTSPVPDAAPAGDGPPIGGNNPAAGEYGTRAMMLERVSEFATAALDGKVYVYGGYPTGPDQTRPTLQIYDPATNMWRLGMPAPIALHHPMLAGVNGKLYSLGGQPNTNLVLEYDPVANAWNMNRMRMPTSRGGGAAAVIGNKIYVVGARPPVDAAAVNAFEVYDVVANNWMTLPKLPARFNNRNHLAAAGIGGKIYVAGGRYNDCCVGAPRTDALEMYDPATNMWTAKANMLRPRGGVAGVAANGCFHVYGGEGNNIGEPNGVYPDHDVYNPATDTWTPARRLAIPFHGVTGGAFIDGLIYMPGGGTSSGGSSGTLMHQVFRPSMRCGE
jgi:N-acetylneuraminic acid mutarotase